MSNLEFPEQDHIRVLDLGYVRLVEDWGRGDAGVAEAGIIEAARQSTQGSFRGWDRDFSLLKHLYTSNPKHAGPFEFAGMTIEVQAPIFVFREWHRHRTQSYNEMSARYAPLPDLQYIPEVQRILQGNNEKKNKQAQGVEGREVSGEDASAFTEMLEDFYNDYQTFYKESLEKGVPKEVARLCMPVGQYSRMRASANLRNWLQFLALRMDSNAQYEIRMYAGAVAQIVSKRFPRTWTLFASEV